jgi:hypothetical protein
VESLETRDGFLTLSLSFLLKGERVLFSTRLLVPFWTGSGAVREGFNIKETNMSKSEKLVIVGGSAGGPSAAARAKRVNPELEITVFEQGRFVSYGS